MRTLLTHLTDYRPTTSLLFWYWLLSAAAYLGYQLLVSRQTGTSIAELIADPSVALAFVAACSVVILAGLLRVAESENLHTLRVFIFYSLVHQLLTGNLLGLILAALILYYQPSPTGERFAPTRKLVLVGGMILIGAALALWLVAQINRLVGG